jgi:hypothetical protein
MSFQSFAPVYCFERSGNCRLSIYIAERNIQGAPIHKRLWTKWTEKMKERGKGRDDGTATCCCHELAGRAHGGSNNMLLPWICTCISRSSELKLQKLSKSFRDISTKHVQIWSSLSVPHPLGRCHGAGMVLIVKIKFKGYSFFCSWVHLYLLFEIHFCHI